MEMTEDANSGKTAGGNEKKMDIEQLLEQGHSVRIYPQGYSMYPMLVPGRDEAVIGPLPQGRVPRRGDVVLYRRTGSRGILVLHRIWKAVPEGVYLVGDNQTDIEGPLRPEQLRGILTSFIYKGREVSVRHPVYVFYSLVWLLVRPFRQKIASVIHFFVHFFS